MNWTKKTIINAIEEARIGVEMTRQILMAVKEFEHYQKVDKRFIDRMKELDCHAYLVKDNCNTKLSISKSEGFGSQKAEFRIYISHVMSKSTLTWEKIKDELGKYNFAQRLLDAKERLELIHEETCKAQEVLDFMKAKKFKCFDFYKSIHEIEDALREALK